MPCPLSSLSFNFACAISRATTNVPDKLSRVLVGYFVSSLNTSFIGRFKSTWHHTSVLQHPCRVWLAFSINGSVINYMSENCLTVCHITYCVAISRYIIQNSMKHKRNMCKMKLTGSQLRYVQEIKLKINKMKLKYILFSTKNGPSHRPTNPTYPTLTHTYPPIPIHPLLGLVHWTVTRSQCSGPEVDWTSAHIKERTLLKIYTYLDNISTKALISDFRHILPWISFKLFQKNSTLCDLSKDLFTSHVHMSHQAV